MDGFFEVYYIQKAVSVGFNRCGLLILLHDDGAFWQLVLTTYHECDIVET